MLAVHFLWLGTVSFQVLLDFEILVSSKLIGILSLIEELLVTGPSLPKPGPWLSVLVEFDWIYEFPEESDDDYCIISIVLRPSLT